MTDLGTLGGGNSFGTDINARGEVAGYAATTDGVAHAFLHDGNNMRDLGTLGGLNSIAFAMNDHSHVVGHAQRVDGSMHAFFYANGVMQDLGTLGGGTFSIAQGINAHDQIVGVSLLADPADTSHGFIYSAGVMRDLNSLIDPASGWVVETAWDINDRGQILGYGCRAGDCTALLLTPGRRAD
jgi:probable HAF family extracellular repeat protein